MLVTKLVAASATFALLIDVGAAYAQTNYRTPRVTLPDKDMHTVTEQSAATPILSSGRNSAPS
jgi:hypothetical protein